MPVSLFASLLDQSADFFESVQPEPRRVFHGRGHEYPGLEHINIDWYPPVALLISYKPIAEPEQHLLVHSLRQFDLTNQISSIILQSRDQRNAPARLLWGQQTDKLEVCENGMTFEVQPGVNQNTGLFLDTRLLRAWLKDHCRSLNVLNLFAYTCSLSVAAISGGAKRVVNLDMSGAALNWGKRNHALNGHDPRSLRYLPHNLFKSWGKIGRSGPYDLIIVDPPSHQPGSFKVEKDYKDVLRKLERLSSDSASLIATVNSPMLNADFLPNQVARSAPGFRLVQQLPISNEFSDHFPERALKIYLFRKHG